MRRWLILAFLCSGCSIARYTRLESVDGTMQVTVKEIMWSMGGTYELGDKKLTPAVKIPESLFSLNFGPRVE